eukprot:COSAG01_NODE_7664_length_3109_cov_1.665337_6_plen_114_part_00
MAPRASGRPWSSKFPAGEEDISWKRAHVSRSKGAAQLVGHEKRGENGEATVTPRGTLRGNFPSAMLDERGLLRVDFLDAVHAREERTSWDKVRFWLRQTEMPPGRHGSLSSPL